MLMFGAYSNHRTINNGSFTLTDSDFNTIPWLDLDSVKRTSVNDPFCNLTQVCSKCFLATQVFQ